jgi:hypothetical protein
VTLPYDEYRMHGSTPSGRSRSYSYYVTSEKPKGFQYHVSCPVIHEQLPELLRQIRVNPKYIPALRDIYQKHFEKLKGPDARERLLELKTIAKHIQAEEADFARLFARKKLSEANYDILRQETQQRLVKAQMEIRRLEHGHRSLIDGLELAIIALSKAYLLYERLDDTHRARLLQILFERIIIDTEGRIVDFTLNPPYEYLSRLSRSLKAESEPPHQEEGSSKQIRPSYGRNCPEPSTLAVEQFVEMLSFPQRDILNLLPQQIVEEVQDGSFVFTR